MNLYSTANGENFDRLPLFESMWACGESPSFIGYNLTPNKPHRILYDFSENKRLSDAQHRTNKWVDYDYKDWLENRHMIQAVIEKGTRTNRISNSMDYEFIKARKMKLGRPQSLGIAIMKVFHYTPVEAVELVQKADIRLNLRSFRKLAAKLNIKHPNRKTVNYYISRSRGHLDINDWDLFMLRITNMMRKPSLQCFLNGVRFGVCLKLMFPKMHYNIISDITEKTTQHIRNSVFKMRNRRI